MKTRRCCRCHESKSTKRFHCHKWRPDKFSKHCRDCIREIRDSLLGTDQAFCLWCEEVKSINDFYEYNQKKSSRPYRSANRKSNGRRCYCIACLSLLSAAWRKADVGRHLQHKAKIKHHFGLSVEEYDAMLKRQGGKCAICRGGPTKRYKRLSVDHDHKTKKVRGLLCSNCNTGLGYFKDDPENTQAATDYLEAHSSIEAIN